MNEATRSAITRALGAAVTSQGARGGGDINQAFQLTLADGRHAFATLNDRAPPSFFQAEARGLRWLSAARALELPEVLGVGDGEDGASPFSLLEWIEPARRAPDFDEQLGRGLAGLHRAGAAAFGLDHDNFSAVYAGHREIDLAMMRLFGGFAERVFEAYAASHPLAPGHRERVALYQLYPLLVHLCTFGSSYLGQVKSCLARYA